jgi:DNA-directed RNA polymerase subunit M/transcription elongation factor TFIIS
MDIVKTKTCKTCNEAKDVSKFSGRRLKCKSCFNKEYAIKYDPKKRTIEQLEKKQLNKKLKDLNMKFCNNCKKELKLKNFDKNRGYICKPCRNHVNNKYPKKKELVAILNKKQRLKNRNNITNVYLKNLIAHIINKSSDIRFKGSDIPQQFIDLKRKELLTKRKIESWQKQQQ